MTGDARRRCPYGKQVKIELIQYNKTSRQLARESGIAESTLCDVLAGRNLSQKTRQKIEEVLVRWRSEHEEPINEE